MTGRTTQRTDTHDMKFDVKKALSALYAPKNREFERIVVPPLRYLAIDGQGDPDGPEFATAMTALYSVAYPLKFMSKKELGRDYVVPPSEALWSADDPTAFATGARSAWKWTLLSYIPDWIDESLVSRAINASGTKGTLRAQDLQLREITEGDSFQVLHIGPYADEAPKLRVLHSVLMADAHVTFGGPHHEIYLSDPRRTSPEKLKTILRQPVRPLP